MGKCPRRIQASERAFITNSNSGSSAVYGRTNRNGAGVKGVNTGTGGLFGVVVMDGLYGVHGHSGANVGMFGGSSSGVGVAGGSVYSTGVEAGSTDGDGLAGAMRLYITRITRDPPLVALWPGACRVR